MDWHARRDSNLRPLPSVGSTLPGRYPGTLSSRNPVSGTPDSCPIGPVAVQIQPELPIYPLGMPVGSVSGGRFIIVQTGRIALVAKLEPVTTHRILVVEDNEHVAYMLNFLLRRAGYDVIAVTNGRDAQSAIENIEPVDVVLLDLMLPYISGYQLIEEIRGNHDWLRVPIVVLSGKVLEEDIVQALDLGANDYVTKPFRPEELLARLRRIVADHQNLAGAR